MSVLGGIGRGIADLPRRIALVPGAARALWRTALEQGPRQRALEAALQGTLGHRRAALVSSSKSAAAAGLAKAFAERSAAYRQAVADGVTSALTDADVVNVGGISWWIPRDERRPGGLASRMIRDQWLPMREILNTRRFVVGGVMLDIGANIGTTSIPRVILGDVERVYAAEPDPVNFACLVQNVAANQLAGFVLPDRVAISDRDGEALLDRASQIGNHRLLRDAEGSRNALAVACRTLDSWVDAMNIELERISFIKSDTQGWDGRVLAGAERVLSHPHIVWEIEFSPMLLTKAGDRAVDLLRRLSPRFSHFVDLRGAPSRVRQIAELNDAMAALGTLGHPRYTNLLLFNTRQR